MGVKEADPEHCPLVAFMTERERPRSRADRCPWVVQKRRVCPCSLPASARVAEGDVLG